MTRPTIRRIACWAGVLACPLLLAGCAPAPEEPTPEEPAPEPVPHVRQEVNDLTPEQIDAYRKGVALMMSREPTDPTSWIYQANIHGVPDEGECGVVGSGSPPVWSTCQHGNFFFLSWHRMYLYYFELILRQAVAEADPGLDWVFALPYWDYEGGSPLPEPFRDPAEPSNPLYVAERRAPCNAGETCVTPAQGSVTHALSVLPFCNCPSGTTCADCVPGMPIQAFGGQWIPATGHLDGTFGALERQPHNVVHNTVGGTSPPGWMALIECAARDPIFWLHHANIDRLWQVWLNQGERANPLGEEHWKTQQFEFYDPTSGGLLELTGCEVLNMATQLDYEYEGLPVENVTLCEPTEPEEEAAPAAEAPEGMTVMAATRPGRVSVGAAARKLALPLPAGAAERMEGMAMAEEPPELWLMIHGLQAMHPGALYEVYLNLPEGEEPDPEGPHFLGHVALFTESEGSHAATDWSFPLTGAVRRLAEQSAWEDRFELTFVLFDAPEEREALAAMPEEILRFSHVSVMHR